MTNKDREAFEAEFVPRGYERGSLKYHIALCGWQAARADLLQRLGSEKMVEKVVAALDVLWVEGAIVTREQSAKAAISAIIEELGK